MRRVSKECLAARDAGLKVFDGIPCIHGHGTKRYTSTNECVECERERGKRRYYKAKGIEGAKLRGPSRPKTPPKPRLIPYAGKPI